MATDTETEEEEDSLISAETLKKRRRGRRTGGELELRALAIGGDRTEAMETEYKVRIQTSVVVRLFSSKRHERDKMVRAGASVVVRLFITVNEDEGKRLMRGSMSNLVCWIQYACDSQKIAFVFAVGMAPD